MKNMPDGTYKRGVETREKIIRTAAQLFHERGCGVSLSDICRDTDIANGNLTYYFKRKTDIIKEILSRMLRTCESEAALLLQGSNFRLDYICLGSNLFMMLICLDPQSAKFFIGLYENPEYRYLLADNVELYNSFFPLTARDPVLSEEQQHYLIVADFHGKLGILRDLLQKRDYLPSMDEILEMAEAAFLLTCRLCSIPDDDAVKAIDSARKALNSFDVTRIDFQHWHICQ